MGQKVHPTGIRLGMVKEHTQFGMPKAELTPSISLAIWKYASYLRKKLDSASVSRSLSSVRRRRPRITIHTARPGISYR